MHSFCSDECSSISSVRFNQRGTRLLCAGYHQLPVIYEVPVGQAIAGVNQEVRVLSQDYDYCSFGADLYCFAGRDDEFVVSVSGDHDLYVWSLPDEEKVGVNVIDHALFSLTGHEGDIWAVRFNHQTGTLVSAGPQSLKLWMDIL